MDRTKTTINNIGVFASSLLVTLVSVYIYSPIIDSHADDSVDVSVGINPVASITLDTNNLVFNVVPTESGTFNSQAIVATVQTNSPGGYELYFSSIDDDTDMVNSIPSINSTISSNFSGTVTSSTMGVNTWGYSLNNTDFSKIPTATNNVKIRDIEHYPTTAESNTSVYIGTKIASSLPSGAYSKSVEFTVLAHENPTPETWDISTMQSMTSNICSAASMGTTGILTDTRDGNTYTATKLKDGKCWMTQNLKIANKTISSADSDITSGTYTIPASDISAFHPASTTPIDPDDPFPVIPSPTSETKAVYINSYGGYYSYYVAAAGTVTSSTSSGTASGSICPKGWRLPNLSSDFDVLDGSYQAVSDLYQGEPSFVFSGHIVENTSLTDAGTTGYYWSNTIAFSDYFTGYTIASARTGEFTQMGYSGAAIRCVAR